MERDRFSLVENTVPFDMRKFRKFKPEFLVEWKAPKNQIAFNLKKKFKIQNIEMSLTSELYNIS